MIPSKQVRNEVLFSDIETIICEGGQVTLRVKGRSMRPFLRDGRDGVVLKPMESCGLRRGMVVLFRYKGACILHRIRKVDGERLILKGDGNYRMTEIAMRSDAIAYVESIERSRRNRVKLKFAPDDTQEIKKVRTTNHPEANALPAGNSCRSRRIAYHSAAWSILTIYSLVAKLSRTVRIDFILFLKGKKKEES